MNEKLNPDKLTWKFIAMKIINSMPTTASKVTMALILVMSVGIFFLPEWRYKAFASMVESAFGMSLLQELFLIALLSWPGLLFCLVTVVRHLWNMEKKIASLEQEVRINDSIAFMNEANDTIDRAYGLLPSLPHPLDGWRDHDFR